MGVFGGEMAGGPERGNLDADETSPEVLHDLLEGGAFIGGYVGRPEAARGAGPAAPRAEAPRPGRPEREPEAARPAEAGSEPYDPGARFLADALYGRNQGGPARAPGVPPGGPPGAPAARGRTGAPAARGARRGLRPPTALRPLPTPGAPLGPEPLVLRGPQGTPPARPARPDRPRETPPEPPGTTPGYWFIRSAAGGLRPAADMTTGERAALERRIEEDARRSAFLRSFRRDHRDATDFEAELAWGAALRASTLDLGD